MSPERQESMRPGLVRQIIAAKTRVKALEAQLEHKTGVRQDQAPILEHLARLKHDAWSDYGELKEAGFGQVERGYIRQLIRKAMVELRSDGNGFRITRHGLDALDLFRKECR